MITVLGTKFSVHRRDGGVEVAVAEGKVQIEHVAAVETAPPAFVGMGDIAKAETGAVLVASNGADAVARELSWRQGLIVFEQSTLAEAAAEFNRYNRMQLIIQDTDVATIPLSGSFRNDNLEAFVRLMSEGFDLTVTRSGNKIIIAK